MRVRLAELILILTQERLNERLGKVFPGGDYNLPNRSTIIGAEVIPLFIGLLLGKNLVHTLPETCQDRSRKL